MTEATDRPWTQEMVIVHRVFRRELRVLAQQIPLVAEGDRQRAALLGDHLEFSLQMLHHHHHGEDELLWPRLKERDALDTALVDRMEAQHAQVAELIGSIEPAVAAWRSKPGPELGVPLGGSVQQLLDALTVHLGEEESQILPICLEHITVAEWNELGQRGMASVPGPKRLFTLGLLMEEATPEEEQRFLGHVPAVPRAIYKLVGRRQYAKQVARLREPAPA